jgi:hypothetical protein
MKNFIVGLFIITTFISCKKDSSPIKDEPSFASKLQKKWILPTNSLNYTWIEFTKGNSYIILQNNNVSKSNKYTISTDNKTVTLANLGKLEISAVSTDVLDFSITKLGSNSPTILRGTAASSLVASTNTDLISQDRNLYKSYDYRSWTNSYDTILYPQTNQNSTGKIKVYAIFTNFGTYFVTNISKTISGFDTTYLNANWNWDNPSETRIAYSYNYNGGSPVSGKVTVLELNTNNFKADEDNTKYFLNR